MRAYFWPCLFNDSSHLGALLQFDWFYHWFFHFYSFIVLVLCVVSIAFGFLFSLRLSSGSPQKLKWSMRKSLISHLNFWAQALSNSRREKKNYKEKWKRFGVWLKRVTMFSAVVVAADGNDYWIIRIVHEALFHSFGWFSALRANMLWLVWFVSCICCAQIALFSDIHPVLFHNVKTV